MIAPAYTYAASVVSLHDGDTITCDIDCGFDIWRRNVTLRLLGINAPELVTKTGRKPNQPGLDSRDALVKLLTSAPTTQRPSVYGIPGDVIFSLRVPVVLTTVKDATEKYGRLLATVWTTVASGAQVHVNQWMLDNHYAEAYM